MGGGMFINLLRGGVGNIVNVINRGGVESLAPQEEEGIFAGILSSILYSIWERESNHWGGNIIRCKRKGGYIGGSAISVD